MGAMDLLLLVTVLTVPFTKFYFEPFGKLVLSNLIAGIYVASYVIDRVIDRDFRTTRSVRILAALFVLTTASYAAGYVGIESAEGRSQFTKAMLTWLLHGSFMVVAAAHLARGGQRLFAWTVNALLTGFAVSAIWGWLQMAGLIIGLDIDTSILSLLPFSNDGTGNVQYYGGGLYRVTGLTLDSNHLGVMMIVPIALSITWLRGMVRWSATALFAATMVLTLSRSALLGTCAALALLVWHERRRLFRPSVVMALLVTMAVVSLAIVGLVEVRPDLARSLIFGRLDIRTNGALTHLRLYTLVPDLLVQSPIFGHGLNSFALIISTLNAGREGFGPHSHYIKMFVETGLMGATLFCVFAGWLLGRLHRVGTFQAAGIAAAIVGTLVGNIFYLTTHIMYVEVLYAMAAAATAGGAIKYHHSSMTTTTTPPAEESIAPVRSVHPSPDGDDGRTDTLRQAFRYWWIPVLTMVLAVSFAAFQNSRQKTEYQASTTVYLGQPVSPGGSLLPTVSAKAATGIELAKGDESIAKAAEAAGVSKERIRRGLVVSALQSPLTSKLQSPPAIIKVAMHDRDPAVAEKTTKQVAAFLAKVTNTYATEKIENLEKKISAYRAQQKDLASQRLLALETFRGARTEDRPAVAVLVQTISNSSNSLQADLFDTEAELNVTREIERSRLLDTPDASKVSSTSGTGGLVVAGFAGLVGGMAIAFLVARLRRGRQ